MNLPYPRRELVDPELLVVMTTHPEPGLVLVKARGEVDLTTSPALAAELDQALLPPSPEHLAVDLGEVTFISSSGLLVLIELYQRSEQCGTATRLVSVSRPVRRVLDMTGLDSVLKLGEFSAGSPLHTP
jgi:stage II sporulation protein AA (anti-sigma F factor antagonist)